MNRVYAWAVGGFQRVKIVAAALCVLLWAVISVLCGAGVLDMLRFFACVVLYVALPGALFARLSGLDREVPSFYVPAAILYGVGFLCVLYCVCMRLHLLPVLYLLPPALSIVYLIWQKKQIPIRQTLATVFSGGIPLTLLSLWGIAVFFYALVLSAKNAHPAAAGCVTLNEDMLWNIGNANSFQLAFPPQDIRFSEVRFAYHYLTEMFWGILSLVSGVQSYDIFIFFAGPVFLAALFACLYSLGMTFYHGSKKRSLTFILVLFGFGCLSLWNVFGIGSSIYSNRLLEHMLTNINAQATGFIFISIFFILFAHMARCGFRVGVRYLLSVLCAFVLVCFAKGPQAAILACALAVVFLFSLTRRPHYGKMLLCYAGCAAVFAAIYFLVFSSGANTSMVYDWLAVTHYRPSDVLIPLMDKIHLTGYFAVFLLVLASIFCIVPFQSVLYVPVLLRDLRHLFHLPEERLLAHGVCAGGFLAYHLFRHPNSSQVYFAYVAIFFMTLLAVDTLPRLKKNLFTGIVCVCGALALATTMMQCAVFAGSGLRNLLYDTGLAQRPYAESYATAGDEEAMQWLRDNTDTTALFVTNRIDTYPGSGSGISSLYTAFSGRQAFMEGYAYAVSNMGVSEALLREKQQVNAAFFTADTPAQQLAEYIQQCGVTHAVYSKQFPGETGALSAYPVVFENESVIIFELQ